MPLVFSRSSSGSQEDIKVSSSPSELSVGDGEVLDAVFAMWTPRRNKLLQPHCRGGTCISQAFSRNIATLEQTSVSFPVENTMTGNIISEKEAAQRSLVVDSSVKWSAWWSQT